MEFTHKVAWKFLKWCISHELLIRKHKGTFESLCPCHEFWSQGGLEVKSRTPLKSVSVIFVMETTYADSWSDWFSLVTLGGHEVKVSMTDISRFSDSWRLWCMNIIVWDNESVCLIWPQSKCRSLWPIFHGPVILPYMYILKTIWATSRENQSLRIFDQARFKPACSTTEASLNLETLDI